MPPYHFGDPLILIYYREMFYPGTLNPESVDQLQAFGAVDAGLVLAPCHDKVWRREDEARQDLSNSSGWIKS